MIVSDYHIKRYGWRFRVYYAVTTYWAREIMEDLASIGCHGRQLMRAKSSLLSGDLNTGITYSNLDTRESVMVISLTSSRGGRLPRGRDRAEDVSGGEEVYLRALQGGNAMWNLIRAFLSGKRGADLYDVMTPEQKETFNKIAAANGVNRRARRKIERDAKKRKNR